MLPLKDNVPTRRFPIVTVVLIVINVIVFGWQLTLSGEEYSSPELEQAGVPEADEAVIAYGAIPQRITSPGSECAVGPLRNPDRYEVVCEGTGDYAEAKGLDREGIAPLIPLEQAPWLLTILASMFMHGGFLHIIGNMLFLWVFGNNVEDSMGRLRFIVFYLLAGAVALYAQAAIDVDSAVPTIGASGAVAGVLGAYALLHPRARVLTLVFVFFFVTFIEIPALILLAIWFVLQFLPVVGQVATQEVAADGGIAYLAHVGGFIFGLAAIKLFASRRLSGPALRNW